MRWILEVRVEGGALGVAWELEVEGDAFDDLLKLKEEMDVKKLGFLVLGFVWRRKGILGSFGEDNLFGEVKKK